MKLVLHRDILSPEFTMGKMTYDGGACYTCEDTLRGNGEAATVAEWKRSGITCIPYGTYQVIVDFSNHFQKPLPHVLNVAGFDGIRIHSGNTPADTEGCILVGTGRSNGTVVNSHLAFFNLLAAINKALDNNEEVWLEVA